MKTIEKTKNIFETHVLILDIIPNFCSFFEFLSILCHHYYRASSAFEGYDDHI